MNETYTDIAKGLWAKTKMNGGPGLALEDVAQAIEKAVAEALAASADTMLALKAQAALDAQTIAGKEEYIRQLVSRLATPAMPAPAFVKEKRTRGPGKKNVVVAPVVVAPVASGLVL